MRGAALALFRTRDREVVLSGPAGTGKTRACLEKLHAAAWKYPGMRGLMVRKTRRSLTQTTMVTFDTKVRHPSEPVVWRANDQEYRYANGSVVVVAGLDKAAKVMSSDYDLIYVNEATDLTLNDWEMLTTRLRAGTVPYQQLLGDCNPQQPSHWLKLRAGERTRMLESRHEDNPRWWDAAAGQWTPEGDEYVNNTLEALTGVRYQRLRRGVWAAADGMVYDRWDPAIHLVDRFPIPSDWPRYWAIDFGFTNPFVCQFWARDPDGRLYRYREIYHTGRTVSDHANRMKAILYAMKEPPPVAIICDHDAEGRATLESELGMRTTLAHKEIMTGIQTVEGLLRPAGDGRPRLYLMRGVTDEIDHSLRDAGKPVSTEEEIEGYVWDTRAGAALKERPIDQDNHGMDALRYMAMHLYRPRRSYAPL